jgi:toxin ParE1/3/4
VKIINLPAADREFARAVVHHHKERPSRAVAFIQEVDHASALLAENPYLGAPEDDDVRGYRLTRFPYTIYYVLRPDRIVIAAIAHQSRRPGYWRKRLK